MTSSHAHPDKSPERVAAMFSAIARHYDLLNHLLSFNLDRSWRRSAVAPFRNTRVSRVLDLCAGTGDFSLTYLDHAPAPFVCQADFSGPMLKIGREKARRLAHSSITFCQADALCLPFPEDTFDRVLCAFGVRNFADTCAGLSEIHRVLVPGGWCIVLEFCHRSGEHLPLPLRFFIQRVLPVIGNLVSGHHFAYSYLPQSITGFYDREELCRLLRSLGFCEVRSRDVTFGVASVLIGRKPRREDG